LILIAQISPAMNASIVFMDIISFKEAVLLQIRFVTLIQWSMEIVSLAISDTVSSVAHA